MASITDRLLFIETYRHKLSRQRARSRRLASPEQGISDTYIRCRSQALDASEKLDLLRLAKPGVLFDPVVTDNGYILRRRPILRFMVSHPPPATGQLKTCVPVPAVPRGVIAGFALPQIHDGHRYCPAANLLPRLGTPLFEGAGEQVATGVNSPAA